MPLIQIADKLEIQLNGFGQYNATAVHTLLGNIYQHLLSFNPSQAPKLPNATVLKWVGGHPMCSDDTTGRLILLTTKNDLWCQWVYQFAHEICHHIIDGQMSGEVRGQIWFEEILCHMSSQYFLPRFAGSYCNRYQLLRHYAPSVLEGHNVN